MADEKIESETGEARKEIMGGVVIYAVLTMCAGMTLMPILLCPGMSFPTPSDGGGSSAAVVASFVEPQGPASRRQLTELVAFRRKHPSEEITVRAVCAGIRDPEAAAALVRTVRGSFPIMLVQQEAITRVVGEGPLPVTVVFDRGDNVVRMFRGFASAEQIAAEVDKIRRTP